MRLKVKRKFIIPIIEWHAMELQSMKVCSRTEEAKKISGREEEKNRRRRARDMTEYDHYT